MRRKLDYKGQKKYLSMLYHGNIVQIAAIDLNSVLLEEGPSRLGADGDSREVEVIKTANPQ